MKQTFQERVKGVVNGYRFRLVSRGVVRATGAHITSYRVTNQDDPRRSYVVTVGAINGCSCRAFELDGRTCKHIVALGSIRGEARQAPDAKPAARAHIIPADKW